MFYSEKPRVSGSLRMLLIMKDFDMRFNILDQVLSKLSKQYAVPKPKLFCEELKNVWGFYALGKITIRRSLLHSNLSTAVRTLRHEFYHYLEDELCLDERKSELKAKRFEKNIWSCEVLPIGQTVLTDFP